MLITNNFNEDFIPGAHIQGWMSLTELKFLYEQAKKAKSILEIGSWKGRSTYALLSGCKGMVTAVDTFRGTDGEEYAHAEAKKEDDPVYKEFMKNVGQFQNLRVIRATSKEAREVLKDEKFDMIFIDGDHSYQAVKDDIAMWKDKAKTLLCGHDYCLPWPSVMKAVDESIEKSGVIQDGSIWYKNIEDESVINMFIDKIKTKENFSFIKKGDGEKFCMSGMVGENCDGHPYSQELGEKLKKAFEYFSTNGNSWVADFEEQDFFNVLLHREGKNNMKVREFYEAIRNSEKEIIYVGPERLKVVARILKAKRHIIVPEKNAFEYYDSIASNIFSCLEQKDNKENKIILFSAGMPAKALIHDLMKSYPDNTYLDLGSSFDSLIKESRTNQLSRAQMLELYADWILE